MAARAKPRRLFEAPPDPEALEPGTVVCLKSGSYPMTLVSLADRDGVMFAELVRAARPNHLDEFLFEIELLPASVLRRHKASDPAEYPF